MSRSVAGPSAELHLVAQPAPSARMSGRNRARRGSRGVAGGAGEAAGADRLAAALDGTMRGCGSQTRAAARLARPGERVATAV
jgi:hypothetical protein